MNEQLEADIKVTENAVDILTFSIERFTKRVHTIAKYLRQLRWWQFKRRRRAQRIARDLLERGNIAAYYLLQSTHLLIDLKGLRTQ